MRGTCVGSNWDFVGVFKLVVYYASGSFDPLVVPLGGLEVVEFVTWMENYRMKWIRQGCR